MPKTRYTLFKSSFLSLFLFVSFGIKAQSEYSIDGDSAQVKEQAMPVSESNKRRFDTILNKDILFQYENPAILKRSKNGIILPTHQWTPLDYMLTFKDTIFYNPAFLPIVFTGITLANDLDFRNDYYLFDNKTPAFHLISPDSTFQPLIERNKEIDALRESYFRNPDNMHRIRYSSREFAQLTPVDTKIDPEKGWFQELITAETASELIKPTITRKSVKAKRWIVNGQHLLQVSQTQVSDNWYSGGNNNILIKSDQKIDFKYKRNKLSWENTVQWKLNIQRYFNSDNNRKAIINEDLLRTYSVLGHTAFKRWSYSTTLEVKTPIFKSYNNSNVLKNSLFSPLDLNLGIGMSYKLENSYKQPRGKKVVFTIDLAPVSLDLRYVGDKEVDETRFGLDQGKNTKLKLGSTVNSKIVYNFNSYTSWESRFKYFTDYKSITTELENKFELALNRYFSTVIHAYLRYDETTKRDDKLGFFQYSETVSFGFSYKW